MGEAADGVRPADGEAGASGRLAREISTLRGEIGDLVGELDRRRREAFDLRLQARRHPVALAVAGLAAAALLGSAVALLVRRGRARRRPGYKARQLRRAVGRAIDHPERVGRGAPPPGEKILAAVGTAAATLLVKRALARAVPSPRAAPHAPAPHRAPQAPSPRVRGEGRGDGR